MEESGGRVEACGEIRGEESEPRGGRLERKLTREEDRRELRPDGRKREEKKVV